MTDGVRVFHWPGCPERDIADGICRCDQIEELDGELGIVDLDIHEIAQQMASEIEPHMSKDHTLIPLVDYFHEKLALVEKGSQ